MSCAPVTAGARPLPRWGPVWLLGVLLLGIIGMHGLSPHGVGGADHASHGLAAAAPAAAAPVGHAAMSDPGGADTARALRLPAGTSSNGMSMAELCVAVLVGFAVLLLLAGAASRRPWWLSPAPLRRSRALLRSRAHSSLSLEQLSLLRC